jgi:cyclomaltodextrinase
VFDLTYDADGAEYLYGYFAGQYELQDYLRQVYLQEVLYPAHAIKLRFLENHDDPRFASKVRDPDALRCWTALMLLLPGATLLYAGQELALGRDRQPGERGEEHYHNERHNVAWEKGDAAFGAFTRNLIAAAKRIKTECRYARVQQLARGVVQIDWRGDGPAYTALLNLENRHGLAPAPWQLAGTDVLTGKEYQFDRAYRIERGPVILKVASQTPDAAREEFRPPTALGLPGGANWA